MGANMCDVIAAPEKVTDLLICAGVVFPGALAMLLAAACGCYRVIVQKKVEAASARVLQEYPEFSQTREDFRAFARKVARELGWDSVTFTFN